jgi:3-hydroxy-9,10-secoandrosta-1,3,5(10)-triene-9,17-dione monooxygenase
MDAEKLLTAARDLVPELRARADEADELRRMPDATVESLRDSGLFRITRPRSFGGHEADYDVFIQVVTELARGCASSAWNLSVFAMHDWFLAIFPEEAQRAVWDADADALICATFAPQGTACRVDGGYRVSGRWQFASGCDHATWLAVGANVENEPAPRSFLLPAGEWEIDDTWFVSGLRGTGSKDVTVDDVFVAEERTLSMIDAISGQGPGSRIHQAPLYRVPFAPALGFALVAVAPGIAEQALEAFKERMRERVFAYSATKQAEHVPAQIALAESAAEIDAARMFIERDCAEIVETLRRGDEVPQPARARARRDLAFAVRLCTRAVDRLFSSSGAHAIFDGSVIQRAFRDVHAIGAHAMHDFELAAEDYGRIELGLDPRRPV